MFPIFWSRFPGEDALHFLDLQPRSARRRPSRLWRRPGERAAPHGTGSSLGEVHGKFMGKMWESVALFT